MSFAVGGNVFFGSKAPQWRDMLSSIVSVLAMIRRPAVIDIPAMALADPTAVLFGTAIFAPIFYLIIAIVNYGIMCSLVRSVILSVYSEMSDKYLEASPDDIKESSYKPSLLAFVRHIKAKRREWRHHKKMEALKRTVHKTRMKEQRRK
ncbi:MAG: hypothetical protein SGPRY_008138, partial [Prymnesium sp.]